jgi:hypothetical protein
MTFGLAILLDACQPDQVLSRKIWRHNATEGKRYGIYQSPLVFMTPKAVLSRRFGTNPENNINE